MKQSLGQIAIDQALMGTVGVSGNRLTAILGDNVLPSRRDVVQRCAPRDGFKAPFSLGSNPAQGGEQPIRRVHALRIAIDLATEEALGKRVVRVSLGSHHSPRIQGH